MRVETAGFGAWAINHQLKVRPFPPLRFHPVERELNPGAPGKLLRGQVGDVGEIVGEHFRFEVTDAKIDGGFTLRPLTLVSQEEIRKMNL